MHIQLISNSELYSRIYNFLLTQFSSGVVYVLNATTKEWEVDVYPNQDRRTAEAAKEFGVSVWQILD